MTDLFLNESAVSPRLQDKYATRLPGTDTDQCVRIQLMEYNLNPGTSSQWSAQILQHTQRVSLT